MQMVSYSKTNSVLYLRDRQVNPAFQTFRPPVEGRLTADGL
jgi:hypothetical protein